MDRNRKIQHKMLFVTPGKIMGWLFAIALVVSSCYSDIGKYNYSAINEVYVDTVGIKTSFVIDQFDSLSIKPNIQFTLNDVDESNLSYRWVIYSDAWSKDATEMVELSTERNLNVIISQEPSDKEYAVLLYITNNENNTISEIKYTVSILKSVVSGWMVLHTDENGDSDIDYIATTNAVPTLDTLKWFHNVFSSINGRKIKGNPNFISGITDNTTGLNYVYIGTDQEFTQLSGKDFEQQNMDLDLFKTEPEFIFPQFVGRGVFCHYVTLLINNGQVQNINNQASQIWDVQFSRPLSASNSLQALLTNEMDISPYVYFTDGCAALTVGGAAVMYDNNNQRFVRLGFSFWEDTPILAFPEQTSGKFDVNNIGKELLFFDKGYNAHGFAVFTDGSSRELYRADFNKASSIYNEDGDEDENPAVHSLSVNSYDLSGLPEIYDAEHYACGPLGNFFLYASDKNIYTFSYASSKKVATLINDPFPANEMITSMKIYNTNSFSPLRDVSATLLYVSTWNGQEGKLYEFRINRASGRLNNKEEIDGIIDTKAPTNIFSGFGKITDMCVKIEGTENE